MTQNYRADHVGSLLRPPEMLQARADLREQRISQEQFKEIEDRAVLAVLDMQRQVGLNVLTDGEYRRLMSAMLGRGDLAAKISKIKYI